MQGLKQYEKLAIQAAQIGAKILHGYFRKIEKFDLKRSGGFVTKADMESEEAISDFFHKKTPEFSILAEENGLQEKKKVSAGKNKKNSPSGKWIIDPLDGTTNFFHKIPHYNISIALEVEGKVVVGVVYNPVTKEVYHTTLGGGAYKNNKRIHVSKNKDLSKAIIGTGFAYMNEKIFNKHIEFFKRFTKHTHGLRRFGAAALDMCYVAAGIYDGFYEETLSPWDIAAGSLLIKEAGGKLT
ncbi:MAG: inositol monophosphatase family protein, partial [Pseudomonadota bacterium]